MPQTPLNQRGPAASASNTSQYSGSAWGSQPPEGGMFLPCCFAFLAGCCRVTRKVKSTPMPWHSYRELDYALEHCLMKNRFFQLFGEEVSFARKQESSETAFFLNQASSWSSLRRKTVNWPARSEVEADQSELAHTSAFSHI